MNDVKQPDEWLMGQVALGRRGQLEPLVRRYSSSLLTYLHRMVGDRHRAEELFQDVFLAVWQKRKTYKFPKNFRSWLFAIATNRCRAEFRKVSYRAMLQLDDVANVDPPEDSPTPADIAVATETARLVGTAVAALPEKQRAVVVMRTWNELSFAEIAQITGTTEGTARANMHHGLAALRKHMEPRLV